MTQTIAPTQSATGPAPLIPRKLLFGYPRRSGPQLSPDGRRLTYLAPDDRGVLQIWLADPDGGADRLLTRDPKRGIREYRWTFLPDHLMYLQDSDGDENYHVYLTHLETGLVRDLTPFQGVRAELVALHHQHPDQVLLAMNIKDRHFMDVYRVHLLTGAVELDTPNPGNAQAYAADRLQIRATLIGANDGGRDLLLRDNRHQPWRPVRHWGPEDDGRPAGFSEDGRTLYLLANHGSNTLRLLAYDTASGQERVLCQDPTYDADCLMTHPKLNTLQAVGFQRDKFEWQFLDDDAAADFAHLAKLHQAECEIHLVSRDLDDTHWLIAFNRDCAMPRYFRFDRRTKLATFLFAANPHLDDLPLSPKQPIRVTARDGLTLHGYLTLPLGVQATNLPVVLYVHGGPWMRDGWAFWSTIQWLANRGYAVLQVNYRGSTGYGKAFLNAGNRRWAAEMHGDLIDAVNWLIGRGIADPKRIAIMGASYGGYATLVGLTFTPDVFCAGVDLVGPANLVTLLNTTPPWWQSIRAMLDYRVGNPQRDEAFLRSRSPVFHAQHIKRPLLIGQGANDPRVKQAESDQIVAAMRHANLPVEYVIYADEGHTLARPENRVHFHALAEQFLAKHLGGRAEPMDHIPGHSAKMVSASPATN